MHWNPYPQGTLEMTRSRPEPGAWASPCFLWIWDPMTPSAHHQPLSWKLWDPHPKAYLISIGKELKEGFSSVQLLSRVRLFAIPWTTARQASLSITNSWSLLKVMSIELVMPSSHLILCYPLLLLPSIFPSIRVFLNESALCIRWPKDWSFSISPSNEREGKTINLEVSRLGLNPSSASPL